VSSVGVETEPILCPSAPCDPDAILLGAVRDDGRVGYLSTRILIDREFAESATEGGSATKRFRFANRCIEDGCQQWGESRCSLADAIAAHPEPERRPGDPLPHCSIRSQCRWYRQTGPEACRSSALVITDAS